MFGLLDIKYDIIEPQKNKRKDGNGMNAINTNERKASTSVLKNKFWSTMKKILLYAFAAVVVVIGLIVLYQILEILFVAAILLIGWVGVVPRRWR